MEKTIVIGDKKFVVRELKAIELDDLDWSDKKTIMRKQLTLSCSLSDEEYNNLTLKERLGLLQTFNEVNGLGDFQQNSK